MQIARDGRGSSRVGSDQGRVRRALKVIVGMIEKLMATERALPTGAVPQ